MSDVEAFELQEKYNYLERLQRSGVTNMFGAGPYLERAFNLSNKEARDVLISWMDAHSKEER